MVQLLTLSLSVEGCRFDTAPLVAVGELRSYISQGQKTKQNRNNIVTNLMKTIKIIHLKNS